MYGMQLIDSAVCMRERERERKKEHICLFPLDSFSHFDVGLVMLAVGIQKDKLPFFTLSTFRLPTCCRLKLSHSLQPTSATWKTHKSQ